MNKTISSVVTIPGTDIWYAENSDQHCFLAIVKGEKETALQFVHAIASSEEEAYEAMSKTGQVVVIERLSEIISGFQPKGERIH